jgi:hypothetical protein
MYVVRVKEGVLLIRDGRMPGVKVLGERFRWSIKRGI